MCKILTQLFTKLSKGRDKYDDPINDKTLKRTRTWTLILQVFSFTPPTVDTLFSSVLPSLLSCSSVSLPGFYPSQRSPPLSMRPYNYSVYLPSCCPVDPSATLVLAPPAHTLRRKQPALPRFASCSSPPRLSRAFQPPGPKHGGGRWTERDNQCEREKRRKTTTLFDLLVLLRRERET